MANDKSTEIPPIVYGIIGFFIIALKTDFLTAMGVALFCISLINELEEKVKKHAEETYRRKEARDEESTGGPGAAQAV